MTVGPRHVPLVASAGLTIVVACSRPHETFYCPDVDEGELVVSELRGPQEGSDTWGQWIELFNASGSDLDLYGLRVTMSPLNGSASDVILVRTERVELPVGGYAVLGRFDDRGRPDHVDYGFQVDLSGDILTAAKVEVEACGVLTDELVYRDLPATGSLALDGAIEPSADANDDELRWCNDANEPAPGPAQTAIGVPGTPGEANPPCP
jgi:hypothetical protein